MGEQFRSNLVSSSAFLRYTKSPEGINFNKET